MSETIQEIQQRVMDVENSPLGELAGWQLRMIIEKQIRDQKTLLARISQLETEKQQLFDDWSQQGSLNKTSLR